MATAENDQIISLGIVAAETLSTMNNDGDARRDNKAKDDAGDDDNAGTGTTTTYASADIGPILHKLVRYEFVNVAFARRFTERQAGFRDAGAVGTQLIFSFVKVFK